MASIYQDIARRGGIAKTFELLRDGHTSHGLTAAVRAGDIIRVRQGHYALPSLPADEAEAYRVGGRLGGASGARHYGIWAPRERELDVSVPRHARALRTRDDPRKRLRESANGRTRVRWNELGRPGTHTVLDAVGCVMEVVREYDVRVGFACVESALHLGHLSRSRLMRELPGLPARTWTMLEKAGRKSESGGESYMRFGLEGLGLSYVQQVAIDHVGRVDFVVCGHVVVEVDGAEFHTTRAAFEEDRRRDAALAALGYRVLRFSYTQVTERWPEVEAALLATLA